MTAKTLPRKIALGHTGLPVTDEWQPVLAREGYPYGYITEPPPTAPDSLVARIGQALMSPLKVPMTPPVAALLSESIVRLEQLQRDVRDAKIGYNRLDGELQAAEAKVEQLQREQDGIATGWMKRAKAAEARLALIEQATELLRRHEGHDPAIREFLDAIRAAKD